MSQASTSGGDGGFTLLELLVVLAIMSLVLMAAPAVYANLIPSYQLRQFANDVANAGRSLREQSRRSGEVTRIVINTEDNLVSATGISLEIPDKVVVSFQPTQAYGSGPENEVEFYSTGASSGGTIVFKRKSLEVLVSFDWVSGAVEVVQ